jgi:hypothetical protein
VEKKIILLMSFVAYLIKIVLIMVAVARQRRKVQDLSPDTEFQLLVLVPALVRE